MATAHITLTYSTTSSTATTATVKVTMKYYGNGVSYNGNKRTGKITLNGSTKSFTHSFTTSTSAQTLGSASFTITKGHSAKTLTASGSFSTGVSIGTLTTTKSVSVAAQTSYTVSYSANGGSGAPAAQTKWYGETLTLSTTKPTRTGYTFAGWYTAASGGSKYGTTYTANANATLYAHWTAVTYTVSYNANGGSGAPSNQTKTYGVNLTLSSTKPTRANYTFVNWKATNGTTYNPGGTYSTNAATTLTAQWVLATYTVTYNANGGTNAPAAQTQTLGTNLTLSKTVPTRSGWTFVGWNTSASATTSAYAPGDTYTENKNVTLYAIWKTTLTLSYDIGGGGTIASSSKTIYNSTTSATFTISSTVPSRSGYTFKGWGDTSSTVKYASGASISISSNKTLYAVWDILYTAPKLGTVTAYRCVSTGARIDTGTYGYVRINWTNGIKGTKTIKPTVSASYKPVGVVQDPWNITLTSTATQAYSNPSFPNNNVGEQLDVATQYEVKIVFTYESKTSSSSTTETKTVIIPVAIFTVDINPKGTGLSLFAPIGDNDTGFFVNGDTHITGSSVTVNSNHFILKDTPSYNMVSITGSDSSVMYEAKREDTNVAVRLGVGSGGINHGVYSAVTDDWIIFGNGNYSYVVKGALGRTAQIGSASSSDHGVALKNFFNANKSTVRRNDLIAFYDVTNGNGSVDFGYFLNDVSGYAEHGGFFSAHYNNPYYVGIQNGTYTQQKILTDTNYSSTVYPVVSTSTISNIISAASGFTIDSASFYQKGAHAMLTFVFYRSSDITVTATGDITDMQIATVVSGKRPPIQAAGTTGNGGGGILYASGAVNLSYLEGTGSSRTIAAGSKIRMNFTYII